MNSTNAEKEHCPLCEQTLFVRGRCSNCQYCPQPAPIDEPWPKGLRALVPQSGALVLGDTALPFPELRASGSAECIAMSQAELATGEPIRRLRQAIARLPEEGLLIGSAPTARFSERALFRALLASGVSPVELVTQPGCILFKARAPGRVILPERSFVRHVSNAEIPAQVRIERVFQTGEAIRSTVIIPTMGKGRESYLKTLLEQLRLQTLPDFEVLVIYGDRRQGRAINCAAAIAQGDVLITLDDDSELTQRDTLANLVRAIEQDPTIGMAGGVNRPPAQTTPFVARVMREIPRRSSPPVDRVIDSDMAEHPCLAMRKKAFYEAGGENEWIPRGLDPYLRARFKEIGWRVVVVPGVVYHHLPPLTWAALLRQFFRNGAQSRFCSRYFPEWALDTIEHHGTEASRPSSVWTRGFRLVQGLVRSGLRAELVQLSSRLAYAAGWLYEHFFPQRR